MVLRAREIMTTRVVTVRADAPLARAEGLLAEYRFSALPVLDRTGRLAGMISVIDLLRHRSDPEAPDDATVADVMTTDVLWMRPDANVSILAHRLRAYGELRVMPIVDRGYLVGVVTRSDLLHPRRRPSPLTRVARRVLQGESAAHGGESAALAAARRAPRPPRDWSLPLTASDVMTAGDLVTVTSTTSVEDAVALLTGHRFSALPVVTAGDELVGIISEADLLRDPLDGRRTARARTVGGAMTRQVITVPPTADLHDVVREMVERGLRVVPVVDGVKLVGVISRSDLL